MTTITPETYMTYPRERYHEIKVTVITPTWQRARHLVQHCVPSVIQQDFSGLIYHLVVSDGPDTETMCRLRENFVPQHTLQHETRWLMSYELGRNWHQVAGGQSWGALPRLAGSLLAHGPYIAYLDDDNAYDPTHIRRLVELIERTGADFVYSQLRHMRKGSVIGAQPPWRGQIDSSTILHRAELLARPNCQWRAAGYASDWNLVERWLQAGAVWAHLPEPTLLYGLDV